ncbi:MAG TPA: helix-turn-helix domain-containing protein [Solirubrobacterales bacterium]|nr:helix-turn-helix domain-containing protein [Solirubrobacterales bacterium]
MPTTAPATPTLSVNLDAATVDRLANAIAIKVADLLPDRIEDCWFDSAEAADYLRLPLSQLRKLSAADLIPAYQDTPGGRLYFLRSELDEWRRSNPSSR